MNELLEITGIDHVFGPDSAPLVLVQYGDYTLRDCQEAQGAVSHILTVFSGQIKFVYRHFVHERVNQAGFVAAKAAEAAAGQGRFWDLHERLMNASHPPTNSEIVAHADELGLDTTQFLREIASDRHVAKIKKDLAGGAVLGVFSVPAFFLNGERIAEPFSEDRLVFAVANKTLEI